MLGVLYRDGRVDCERSCTAEAASHFERAARAGDLPSLVAFAELHAKGEAGAPSAVEVIDLERARAEDGDAVSAWRLVRRIDAGEIDAASTIGYVALLEAVAAEKRYPRAADAAYKLCQHHISEAGATRIASNWCEQAAEAGMPAAALALYRFKSVDG
jgi:TPR repeat protein